MAKNENELFFSKTWLCDYQTRIFHVTFCEKFKLKCINIQNIIILWYESFHTTNFTCRISLYEILLYSDSNLVFSFYVYSGSYLLSSSSIFKN